MNLKHVLLLSTASFLLSCNTGTVSLNGTWRLVSATTITKTDTVFTDFTKDQSMIKIINDTHFAFLKHSLKKDTVSGFDAGGGTYTLKKDQYTEHLDYYNDKNWEGKTFDFTVSVSNDTLTQQGLEEVEAAGVKRVIIEKYVKIK